VLLSCQIGLYKQMSQLIRTLTVLSTNRLALFIYEDKHINVIEPVLQ